MTKKEGDQEVDAGGGRDGEEDEKKLRCIIYMCLLHTRHVNIMHHKDRLTKKMIPKKLMCCAFQKKKLEERNLNGSP